MDNKALELVKSEEQEYQGKAKDLVIRSKPDYDRAAALTIANKRIQQKIVDLFKLMKTKAHEAWKQIVAQEKEMLDPLQQEEAERKRRMGAWWRTEETKRLEKERAEQAKLQAELEAKRDAQVEKLAEMGETKAAAELQDEEIIVPEVKLQDRGKVEGISKRDNWIFVIVDETQIPRDFLMVDDSKIRQYVKAMKADAKIPGVKVYNEPILAVRS